jgi:long-chain acyl-CoA synthetase
VTNPAPRTVPELLLWRVEQTPDEEAFRYPAGGGWESLTWRQSLERIRAVASGLLALGLAPEQRVSILSSTRYEWILADYGILCAGGATTTLYPSNTAEECAYILGDSQTAFLFAENDEQVRKVLSRRAELPRLRGIVTFDGRGSPDGFVLAFSDLLERGRAFDARSPGRFDQAAHLPGPDALATLIYTSGTTGRPKGVELTHACWVAQSASVEASGILAHRPALQFFWLPLAHSFGKMIGTAQLRIGFPTAVDGRVERIVENLAAIRPTFVCAVPRIFERVHAKVMASLADGGALKESIARWAIARGLAHARARREGRAPGLVLDLERAVADRLVFSKIRSLFGGRLQFFVSGSAPLSREIGEFFDAVGVVILEGYGLTESSAATHVNLPGRNRVGTVGPALAGVDVRIAPDGEVLMRGPWIMRGYHDLPEQTREALVDGWLQTGDIGHVDADGFLSITDRKKDLIKTSGGKYVAPQELEGRLKALSPYLSQVLVHGDRRNYCVALVTLDPEAIGKWAAQHGLGGRPMADLARRPEVYKLVQGAVADLNATLPRYATVKKFAVLEREFTEQAGEVTASQKLRRKVIEQCHRERIDGLYARGDVSPG